MINPMSLLQLHGMKKKFDENHPRFQAFLKAVFKKAIKEDAVFEINVTTPEGEKICTNFKVKQSDLELLQALNDIIADSRAGNNVRDHSQ